MKEKTERFEYVDAMRGLAILLVIFGHSGAMTGTEGVLKALANGCMMGVHLFFVISGFTIFYMLDKHACQETHPVRNFFIRRFFRIVPLYWFAILYYMAIWGTLKTFEWWHYPAHVFLLNALHPEPQTSAVPGGWSISIEMLFYLSVPFIFKRVRDLSSAFKFFLICVLAFPPVVWLLSVWCKPLFAGMNRYLVYIYWERFPLISIGCFAAGILLFYLLKNERVNTFIRDKNVNLVGVIAVGSLLGALPFLGTVYPVQAHFYACVFMFLILLLAAHPWRILVNPLLTLTGKISYSMYIFHFSIQAGLYYWISANLPSLTGHPYLYFAVFFFLTLALCVPAAWCGHRFIEQPFIELSRKLTAYLESRTAENEVKMPSQSTMRAGG